MWTEYEKGVQENGTLITFKGLTQTQAYKVKVRAVDNAGNQKEETYTQTITTDTVTGLTATNTVFEYSPTGWTNEKVRVTIKTGTNSGTSYQLQYSVGDIKNWTEYKSSVEVNENKNIYARLWDGNNGGSYATGSVTKIDKNPPTGTITIGTTTTKSIAVKVTGTDKTGESGIASITCYCKTASGTETNQKQTYKDVHDSVTGETSRSKDFTFDNLVAGSSYTIRAVVEDVAGNTYTINNTTASTLALPKLVETNIECTPTNWTNQSVKVNITATLLAGCKVQYRFNNAGTWTNYNQPFLVETNKTVNARITDTINNGVEVSKTITNIDTVKPTGTLTTKATTKSITVTVKATDDLSGLKTITWYCKKPDGTVIKSDTKNITN